MTVATFPRTRILGVEVDLMTNDDVTELILESVTSPRPVIIANHNLHSIFLYHRERRFADFFDQADAIHVDGMGVVWAGRMGGVPIRSTHRATTLEFLDQLLPAAEQRGLRIFYLGSEPDVLEAGLRRWKAAHPGLRLAGHHGYFRMDDATENDRVVAAIAAHDPHMLMVGMGMPRQEHWIMDNVDRIPARVVLPVGARLDYAAGAKSPAPRWVGRLSLEWAYRLVTEPRRLWRRYLVEPWFLLPFLVRDVLRRFRVGTRAS